MTAHNTCVIAVSVVRTFSSVARAVGVHPNYLSELFTRHGGASFHFTVETQRIERAKALLRTDADLSVAEIGRRCGYGDAGHFIRVFERHIGHTPGTYAKEFIPGTL